MTEKPKKWDTGNFENDPNAHWVKLRSLVGTTFSLVSVKKGVVNSRPSYIFKLADGALFSVNQQLSGIGRQIDRAGLPPAGQYTLDAKKSGKSPTGDSLVLRAVTE